MLIACDYLCPTCGPFDSLEDRPAPPVRECPRCGELAELMFPCARIKTQWAVAGSTAKSDPAPHSGYMPTELLADGQRQEYADQRAKHWELWRQGEIKKRIE